LDELGSWYPGKRCPREAELPLDLMVRMLMDDRRIVAGRVMYTPLQVAAIYANYNHKYVKDEDTRDLIRRLLQIHGRAVDRNEPLPEEMEL
jgi:hypothetical protein